MIKMLTCLPHQGDGVLDPGQVSSDLDIKIPGTVHLLHLSAIHFDRLPTVFSYGSQSFLSC